MKSAIFLLKICLSIMYAQAIMFNLNPNTQKCLKEEMQAHQIIAGEFEVSSAPGQKIDYVVSVGMNGSSWEFIDFDGKFIQTNRCGIQRDTFSHRRKISPEGNSQLRQKFMTPMKYVSFRRSWVDTTESSRKFHSIRRRELRQRVTKGWVLMCMEWLSFTNWMFL